VVMWRIPLTAAGVTMMGFLRLTPRIFRCWLYQLERAGFCDKADGWENNQPRAEPVVLRSPAKRGKTRTGRPLRGRGRQGGDSARCMFD
jgi:hypothetical protein